MNNTALQMFEPTDSALQESLSRKTIREGEERLMLALLENATEDFQKYIHAQDRRGKAFFDAAEEWFLETDSPAFFSFENICEYLQLDPCYVRKGMMRWKETHRNDRAGQCSDGLNAPVPPAQPASPTRRALRVRAGNIE